MVQWNGVVEEGGGDSSVGGSTVIVSTEPRVGFAEDSFRGCGGKFFAESVMVVGDKVLFVSDPCHQWSLVSHWRRRDGQSLGWTPFIVGR